MLRNYTHNSLHKSFIKPKQLVKAAKEREWEFVGLCDTNTLSGMVEFYKACQDNEIKPVIGCELKGYPYYALNRDGLNVLISLCSKIGLGEELTEEEVVELQDNENLALFSDKAANYFDGDLEELKLLVDANKDFTDEQKAELIENSQPLSDYQIHDEYVLAKSIADQVEDYELASRPILPSFVCPNNMSQDEYLRHFCREGWREKLIGSGKIDTKEEQDVYVDRVKYELEVLQGAGLSGYFLVVHDIINFVREKGWIPGPGRGCFLPDTRVKMSDGTYKAISTVKIGDKVIDAYGESKEVKNTLEYDINEEIIELEMDNEKVIRCTKDHKFLTKNRGWVQAQHLTEEDDIVEV